MAKNKRKFLIIVGARPNFIKTAPLLKELKKYKNISAVLLHTGQHYDYEMSEVFFKSLNISKPKYNLNIASGPSPEQIARMMIGIEKVCFKENPDLIIVFGDVNSTLAGALVAVKLDLKLAHIESGLRSYDRSMPEEINRVLTDEVSNFLFCPTKDAVANLKKEGIKKNIFNAGDIMHDVFLKNKIKKSNILKKLKLIPKEYLLLTIHRSANADNLQKLESILWAVGQSKENIIFPCHPRTRKTLKNLKIGKNIKIIKPVGYFDILELEKKAKKIITDSGGIQKEAYWAKVPCITLRNNTEWKETLKGGWNILVGSNKSKILNAIKLPDPKAKQKKYFGNGNSAKKIAKILSNGKIF